MSRVARQKHIKNELWTDDYSLPKENQKIAKIRMPKGNNLHEVRVGERENCPSPLIQIIPSRWNPRTRQRHA